MSNTLDLLDYRRQVSNQYAAVRAGGAGEATWQQWRDDRDRIFATHPQSPIEDRTDFTVLSYFAYDPSWRLTGAFAPAEDEDVAIPHSRAGATIFRHVGEVNFEVDGQDKQLDVLWLNAYGGGLFIPFRDRTNGVTTYGGGRYLIDTVKGADLGHVGDELILDFNYAYHPSCVHSPRWSCPLAPPGNTLDVEVTAGERGSE